MKILDFKYRHRLTSLILNINIRGSGIVGGVLARILLPKPEHKIIMKTKHDFNLLIDPKVGKGVERCLYNFGTYEFGILKLMENLLRKGDIFVDVGANIGLMSIHASLIVSETGRVLSFEAHPNTIKILQHNIQLNNVENVTAMQLALGSKKSRGKIYSNLHINRGSASLLRPDFKSECFDVEIARFDDFYQSKCLPTIRMVKIDIEGFELEALKGFGNILSGKNAPILIIECSEGRENYQSSKEDMLEYINEINLYHIYKLKNGKERSSKLVKLGNVLPKHDNIICFLQNHLNEVNKSLFEISPQ